MKKYIILCILFLSTHFVFGQYAERVRSARPGNTMGVFTVGKGVFQAQQFFRFSNIESTTNRLTRNTLGTLVRLGITERFEVQAVGNLGSNRNRPLDNSIEPFTNSGISGLALGARYHLGQPLGENLFRSALQVRVNLPHESDISAIDFLRTTIALSAGQKLAPKFILNTAISYQINSDDAIDNRLGLGVRARFRFNEKMELMLEHFGTFTNNNYIDGFDAGVDYFVSNNVKLDLSAGWQNLNGDRSNFGVLGITYRFHNRNNLN